MNNTLLTANNIKKSFNEGPLNVGVLKGLEFSVNKNETIAIIGSSGSGKSTLLHLLGGLDVPDSGNILINNQNINKLNDAERGVLRNKYLGFIYQFHHLLPEFTAVENVALPLLIRRDSRVTAEKKAKELLCSVGLSERLQHKPGELSGGERQRTAIARALVTNPKCILADEPTGNLDEKSAHEVFELIISLNKNLGSSLIMVTHNLELSKQADRVFELKEGKLYDL
ncbi:MAG: lipoprotein-releasing system ATP-binding protein LolD [Legionellales bacterium]|nr:lipoprotein-releasing system ATP-binding protein LolD [Legionellales bacterium]